MEDFDDKELIGWLEEQGAIVWEGLDPSGEPLFKFNLDILQVVMPELYKEVMEDIDTDLLSLYQDGLLDVEYDENLNALFKPTQKAIDLAEKFGLPPYPLQD